MRTTCRSDIGRIRMVNEDRGYDSPHLNGFAIGIVADGMGGHQAGDTASQLAVDQIREKLAELDPAMGEEALQKLISGALAEANQKIYELSRSKEKFSGMGTTAIVVIAGPEQLSIGHVGDSRVYLCRGDSLSQLTEDHTLVNELIKSGQLSKEEAENHPRRHVIMRALGTEEDVKADIQTLSWEAGDTVLLCSDGLSGLVPESRICEIIHSNEDLENKADLLIHSALEAGGDDNITVVLLVNDPENPAIKR